MALLLLPPTYIALLDYLFPLHLCQLRHLLSQAAPTQRSIPGLTITVLAVQAALDGRVPAARMR